MVAERQKVFKATWIQEQKARGKVKFNWVVSSQGTSDDSTAQALPFAQKTVLELPNTSPFTHNALNNML